MNFHNCVLICLCLVVFQVSLQAQESAKNSAPEITAKEVVDDYIEALGGEMVLRSIKTIQYEYEGGGRYAFQDGKTAYQADGVFFHYWIKGDTLFWEDASSRHRGSITEVDVLRATGDPYAALRLLKIVDQLIVLSPDKYKESEFAHCVCLEVTATEGRSLRRYFDRETGLLAGCEIRYQSMEKTKVNSWSAVNYSEYKGVKFIAKSISYENGVEQTTSICRDFQIDCPVDEAMFRFR